MKFGEYLEANRYAPFLQGYVEYDFMRQQLYDIVERKGAGKEFSMPRTGFAMPTHPNFSTTASVSELLRAWARLLEEEFNKVEAFTQSHVEELQGGFSLLSRRCGAATTATVAALKDEAFALSNTIVELDK